MDRFLWLLRILNAVSSSVPQHSIFYNLYFPPATHIMSEFRKLHFGR